MEYVNSHLGLRNKVLYLEYTEKDRLINGKKEIVNKEIVM